MTADLNGAPRADQPGQLLVAVGSRSRAKTVAVQEAFELILGKGRVRIQPVETASAPKQPMTDLETLEGAAYRAMRARAAVPEAAYTVGIEGGVEEIASRLMVVAWAVVTSGDRIGRSRSATFELPDQIAEQVRSGVELGVLTAKVAAATGRPDEERVTGLIGTLTADRVTRHALYVQPTVLALVRFLPEWSRVEDVVRTSRHGVG